MERKNILPLSIIILAISIAFGSKKIAPVFYVRCYKLRIIKG